MKSGDDLATAVGILNLMLVDMRLSVEIPNSVDVVSNLANYMYHPRKADQLH